MIRSYTANRAGEIANKRFETYESVEAFLDAWHSAGYASLVREDGRFYSFTKTVPTSQGDRVVTFYRIICEVD